MSSSVGMHPVMSPSPRYTGFARWRSIVETLERQVTLSVTLLLVIVIGGMFWLSHSRVIDAVSSSELSRLQASSDQVAQTLTSQTRRLIENGGRFAATPALRAALSAPNGDSAKSALRLLLQRDGAAAIYTLGLLDVSGKMIAATGPIDSALLRQDRALRLETATGPVMS